MSSSAEGVIWQKNAGGQCAYSELKRFGKAASALPINICGVPVSLFVGRLDLLVRMYHNRLCTYRIKLPRFQESNTVGV